MPETGMRTSVRARRVSRAHLHWFRWTRYDDFSAAGLYTCRCGTVRPGF